MGPRPPPISNVYGILVSRCPSPCLKLGWPGVGGALKCTMRAKRFTRLGTENKRGRSRPPKRGPITHGQAAGPLLTEGKCDDFSSIGALGHQRGGTADPGGYPRAGRGRKCQQGLSRARDPEGVGGGDPPTLASRTPKQTAADTLGAGVHLTPRGSRGQATQQSTPYLVCVPGGDG